MLDCVLIINENTPQLRQQERIITQQTGYQAQSVPSLSEATQWLQLDRQPRPDVVIANVVKITDELAAWIQTMRALQPYLPVIVFTDFGDEGDDRADLLGIFKVMPRPVAMTQLRRVLANAIQMRRMRDYISWLERKVTGHVDFRDVIGQSSRFSMAIAQAKQVVSDNTAVLICGENGTGKELVARAIHGAGRRSSKPFVSVNCEMLPPHLMESLLFGQGDGVSTAGFIAGKLREADQGTLLLQEAGALPPLLRQKLQDVIETGKLTPVDAQAPIAVDVRFMFSQRAKETTSTEPLDWAVKTPAIFLPPLRERGEDILLLGDHMLAMYTASENKYVRGISERARQWILHHPWPGNTLQLSRLLWRAVVMCDGDMIDISDLQTVALIKPSLAQEDAAARQPSPDLIDAQGRVKTLKSIEEEAIRYALQHSGGSMTRAARILGIGRSTLYRKVGEMERLPQISRANQTTRPTMKASSTDRS
jgi:DNA-binding NtrC family response regulator